MVYLPFVESKLLMHSSFGKLTIENTLNTAISNLVKVSFRVTIYLKFVLNEFKCLAVWFDIALSICLPIFAI